MIREVIIDNQQIDIENDNAAGYIFTSPIFRDITKILSNRTTTYKIPKTQKNLNIFGLSDNADVFALFPYREHTFEENRDGLPFIKGICTLLKSSDELELSVIWGNTINLLQLKDLKLRELDVVADMRSVQWNNTVGFLPTSSLEQKGFIVMDFGKGTSIENSRPSVTLQYILNLITNHSGVHFTYPARFTEVFAKTWVPLNDNIANSLTWNDSKYWVESSFKGFTGSPQDTRTPSSFKFDFPRSGNSNLIQNNPSNTYTVIKAKSGSTVVIRGWQILNAGYVAQHPEQYKLKVYAYGNGTVFQEQFFDIYIVDNDITKQRVNINLDMSFDVSEDVNIEIRAIYTKDGINQFNIYSASLYNIGLSPYLRIYVRYKDVRFGDIYPIIPNLPDLSVIDFLKTIMQMYGLFTYYDYRLDSNTIQFISIDDIYSLKANAYDWTNKLVNTNKGKFNLSYIYGEYAQRNNLKYKQDEGVFTNADGYIAIDNTVIPESKDLVELPFSSSDNTVDENNNQYAKINLFAPDGSKKNISYRIVLENKYRNTEIDYKSGLFDETLKFGSSSGLLATYYSSFQHILLQPIVADCYVYLSEYELHLFREVNPVYIDGVYYAPIEVTVQTDGLAVCKLIRMPYK